MIENFHQNLQKQTHTRHVVIKFAKCSDKEKNLKSSETKEVLTYKGKPIKLAGNFSTETCQAGRELHDIFKVLNVKNLQPRILYPARVSFRIDGNV